MTKTTRMRLLAVLVGLLFAGTLGGAPAHVAASFQAPATRDAQDPPAAPNRSNRSDPSDPLAPVSTGELVNMLDTYAIVRAQAELTLSDAQYAQFVTRLKRLQEARRRNQRERNQILQDLRRLTGPLAPTPDETVVRERLKALRDHDERATVEMRKAYETLDEVLDVRQQARFRIFEETIERRKLDLVLRARERANRSGRGGQ